MSKVRIAHTKEELLTYLDDVVSLARFVLTNIDIAQQDKWEIRDDVLIHHSNGFFQVCGLKHQHSNEEHLVLFQPQSALTGLLLYHDGTQMNMLLQARVEPGNSGIGQFGPTIQSTAGNYLRLHGGKKTSYYDIFTSYKPFANPIGYGHHIDLGKRYFHKSKVLSYFQLNEMIDTEENMIWVPLKVVESIADEDNLLNTDLRSLLSVFDWDQFSHADQIVQENTVHGDSNIFIHNELGAKNWKLCPINKLQGWQIGPKGITDEANNGIWVNMYQVEAETREVSSWPQPMMCAANKGIVVLLIRQNEGRWEFLLTVDNEFGTTGEKTILPSFMVYPGDNHEELKEIFTDGKKFAEAIQSEEGGRFYLNENIYQIYEVSDEINVQDNQRWVSRDIFKSLLKTSNKVSIQMRCAASLVLKKLNPITFSERT